MRRCGVWLRARRVTAWSTKYGPIAQLLPWVDLLVGSCRGPADFGWSVDRILAGDASAGEFAPEDEVLSVGLFECRS